MEESKYNDIVAAKIKEISADMQAQRNDLDGAFAEYNLIRNQYLLKVRKLADKIFTEGENGAYIPSWKEKVYLDPQKLVVSEASTWFRYIKDEHNFPKGYREGKLFLSISLSGSPLSVDNRKIKYFFDALGVKDWFIDVSSGDKSINLCWFLADDEIGEDSINNLHDL